MAEYVQDKVQLVKPGDTISLKPRYLRKGSLVAICISKEDRAVTPGMMEYNGEIAAVARIYRPKKTPINNNGECCYELEGVVSQYGVPYTFTKNMLM